MKLILLCLHILLPIIALAATQGERTVISLNGIWQFDQTINAFPPPIFTRTIIVPGLVHLATPKIEDYDKFFKRADKMEAKSQHNFYDIDYVPRYSWYRKTVYIPEDLKLKDGVITIKKSQYVTQVYVNGIDMGTSIACYTPVEFPINSALKFGRENEILIKVGDRVWLPAAAAGSTDKEKEHYLPGIWDDVELSFTGKLRMNRILALPSVKEKKVTIKFQLQNFFPAQIFYGDQMIDSCELAVSVMDSKSGKRLGTGRKKVFTKRDNIIEHQMEIPLQDFLPWTPEEPNLCTLSAELIYKGQISDRVNKKFGMRDFTREGKFFYLNGKKIKLRGTNVTLQRFFEDPDCSDLVWNREWVKKLLIDIPKGLNWNMMRICVGIVPDFWYDLADEYGLMFQNEWLYWQNHGWNEQINKEYTDWVWNDGTHPSIVIWDAINENQDDYIGNILIPELKILDPTRVWDAGYMTGSNMGLDEMDEPHPYEGRNQPSNPKRDIYPLGNLNYENKLNIKCRESQAVQLVNEYGWVWLLRNGAPSKLTIDVYNYYVGEKSTPQQNRLFQAYWLQLETEWLRSKTYHAGVLAFCYLTNNYGYTGDWFVNNIKDLEAGPTLDWFKHAFAPQAVFINLTDQRYLKNQKPFEPGRELNFKLYGINDKNDPVSGETRIYLYNSTGEKKMVKNIVTSIPASGNQIFPVKFNLPKQPGGYLLVVEFTPVKGMPVISRRFLKVGQPKEFLFFNLNPMAK